MGDIIKSAREISEEKVARLGAITEEERLQWKYVPEGEKLAGRYMKEDLNLAGELAKFPENARRYVKEGASDIMLRGITLPRNDAAKRATKRAMEGLKAIKTDKVAVENVFSRLRRIFDHYAGPGEQQRKQSYERTKVEFTARLQQAARKQYGAPVSMDKIDVARQPQFQEEWRLVLSQLDAQYVKVLDELKLELSTIP